MKKVLKILITNAILIIMLLFIFQHSVQADLIGGSSLTRDILSKNNESKNEEKGTYNMSTYYIAGGAVLVLVGTSIMVLRKSKKKNEI